VIKRTFRRHQSAPTPPNTKFRRRTITASRAATKRSSPVRHRPTRPRSRETAPIRPRKRHPNANTVLPFLAGGLIWNNPRVSGLSFSPLRDTRYRTVRFRSSQISIRQRHRGQGPAPPSTTAPLGTQPSRPRIRGHFWTRPTPDAIVDPEGRSSKSPLAHRMGRNGRAARCSTAATHHEEAQPTAGTHRLALGDVRLLNGDGARN